MSRCGRPVRRAVSRPVCADEKNPALSVDRKFRGASTVGPHTAQPAPAVAPHDPPRQADACRSAIGRPILVVQQTRRWRRLARPTILSSGDPSAAVCLLVTLSLNLAIPLMRLGPLQPPAATDYGGCSGGNACDEQSEA